MPGMVGQQPFGGLPRMPSGMPPSYPPPYDMSEFPALGSGRSDMHRPPPGAAEQAMSLNADELFKRQPGAPAPASGPKQPEFTMSNEDFPALSSFRQPQQPSGRSTTPDPVADQYGMMGLLGVVRMTNPDLNLLALGTDLTVLGLNLNSGEPLYSSFVSPFSDTPTRRDPEFKLPSCYVFPTPPSLETALQKMTHYSEETLFYMFYSLPGDVLQLAAAQELTKREWRYHKELKAWFLRVPGTELSLRTAQFERGSYFYFDISTWQRTRKDNFLLMFDQLESF